MVVLTLPKTYWPDHLRDDSLLGEVAEGARVARVSPALVRHLPVSSAGYTGSPRGSAPRLRTWDVMRRLKDLVLVPDTRITWVRSAAAEARRLHPREPFDAILSTSPESSSHIAARLIARRIGKPWVADFRDPWRSVWTRPPTALHAWGLDRLGARLMARADAITVVSGDLGADLRRRYRIPGDKVSVVMHGVDDRALDADAAHRTGAGGDRLTVVHTGALYGRRQIEALLRATRQLLTGRPDLNEHVLVKLTGPVDDAAVAALSPFRSEPWLEVHEAVPHGEALRLQRDADVLLLIPGLGSPTIPGKLFEYLGAGRPILALCPAASDPGRLVRELDAGIVVEPDDERGIAAALEGLIANVPSGPTIERVRTYTRSAMAQRMAAVLDGVAGGRDGS